MSMSPDWMKIFAPYLSERNNSAIRRWPRDQNSGPEVKWRDVISQTQVLW